MKKLVLLLMPLVCLSCQREPNKTAANYTSESAIERAQNKSLSKLNPYSVRAGQWVHFIETQEVISSQGSNSFLSKEWTTEVGQVEDLPDGPLITLFRKVTDYLLDENFVYEFKEVMQFLPPEVVNQQKFNPLKDDYHTFSKTLSRLKETSERQNEIVGVSYQNLQVKRVIISPPENVKKLPDCAGVSNCKLEGDQITYDVVFLFEDESTQRHTVEWLVSEDVPFYAGLLKQCTTSFVPVDDLRVLVKQCRDVVDFKK